MTRPIGYYVHHHGDGHRQRAIAIGQAMDRPVTLLGTGLSGRSGDLPCIDLPDDRLDDSFAGVDGTDRPPALHYAPIDHDGIRRRIAALTQWIATARPALKGAKLILDVSTESSLTTAARTQNRHELLDARRTGSLPTDTPLRIVLKSTETGAQRRTRERSRFDLKLKRSTSPASPYSSSAECSIR